ASPRPKSSTRERSIHPPTDRTQRPDEPIAEERCQAPFLPRRRGDSPQVVALPWIRRRRAGAPSSPGAGRAHRGGEERCQAPFLHFWGGQRKVRGRRFVVPVGPRVGCQSAAWTAREKAPPGWVAGTERAPLPSRKTGAVATSVEGSKPTRNVV